MSKHPSPEEIGSEFDPIRKITDSDLPVPEKLVALRKLETEHRRSQVESGSVDRYGESPDFPDFFGQEIRKSISDLEYEMRIMAKQSGSTPNHSDRGDQGSSSRKPIQWTRSQTLLVYFIAQLCEQGCVIDNGRCWAWVAANFLNKSGKPFKADHLAKVSSDQKSGNAYPRDVGMADRLLKNLKARFKDD